MPQVLIVANATAGSADDEVLDSAVGLLRARGDVDVVRTGGPDELQAALRERPAVDVVVAAGGDGSLHALIAALHTLDRLGDVVVGLLPLGTGNDFARTLGLDEDPLTVAAAMLDADPVPLDLAVDDDGGVVVNALHVGVGAEATRAAEPLKKWLGPLGYPVGALRRGLFGPARTMTVAVDGRVLDGGDDVIQVAVGVGRFVGGGTPLLPEADPTDGLLDVTISHAARFGRRVAYGLKMLRGTHTRLRDTVSVRAREVTISGRDLVWNVDGETGDGLRERTWRLQHGAYRMLVPAGGGDGTGPDLATTREAD
ncbi:YegS/Rv2252/BmrU family lipid kinase [Mumia flava]|uniref:YegS/Rv2252/BmrU family lipid kinase n=1 Tax=Mumia flava TaxID=1348852 RepID=A0A2M9BH52_9ACTN|nr:YegS/Rv2252/BmrU family lipid kinase [Mumia flava]PJJ57290.1 YegS/Rv2252/BmrU family lipid kinase [Mumia flava]